MQLCSSCVSAESDQQLDRRGANEVADHFEGDGLAALQVDTPRLGERRPRRRALAGDDDVVSGRRVVWLGSMLRGYNTYPVGVVCGGGLRVEM